MNFNRYFSLASCASTIVLSVAFSTLLLAVLLTAIAPGPALGQGAVPTQQSGAQSDPDTDGFYSGNVVELAPDRVTVSRTILGKPPEKRVFQITAATKVEGKLKTKSRVTVRYSPGAEGDVAVSILVRADKGNGNKK